MIPAHEKLVDRLLQAGDLPQHWSSAFERVERHRFLPCQIAAPDGTLVDQLQHGERWLELAYEDIPVVTRVDDGAPGTSGCPTSSTSKPSIVADMLRRLNVWPGMNVLEIGTGTGYNAGLLSHFLDDESVTTVEIDPVVAEQARINLMSAGFTPLVVTGDGLQGWSPRAPFDRVISTATVQRVPYHWVAQTKPGGHVLTLWGNAFHHGTLVDLRVGPNGTASGQFGGDMALMWVRDQHNLRQVVEEHVRDDHGYTVSHTELHPQEPVNDFDASFAIGLRMPTVLSRIEFPDAPGDRGFVVYLVDPPSDSWASWHVDPDAVSYEVRQHGPRQLFGELESAHRWWIGNGRPSHSRFGLTVAMEQQLVWLDQPGNLIASMP